MRYFKVAFSQTLGLALTRALPTAFFRHRCTLHVIHVEIFLHFPKKYVLTFPLSHMAIPSSVTETFKQGFYLNQETEKQA